MGKLLLVGIGMILWGVGQLFVIGIMAIGGLEVMVGIFLPIMLRMAPTDQQLLAWVEIPLSMAIDGELSNVRTFKEDGYLGGGMMDFKVTMAGGGPESSESPTVAAIWIQDGAEIDEVSRYVLVAGPLNYGSIFFWLCAMGSLGALGAAVIYKIFGSKKSPTEGIERGESAPPGTTVQVIALDDTAFKE